MNKTFKPAGYNSASPYFIVNDAAKFMALIVIVFDGRELRRYERPDGKIMHAEMQIDDSVIMIADATDQYPPVPIVMHVYVPDADQTFQKAVQAGCEIIAAPKDSANDPDRRATFKDFAGNVWSVGTKR